MLRNRRFFAMNFKDFMMPSWAVLSRFRALGAILGRLGAILGPSGLILGPSWAVLGLSWAPWGYLGAVLGLAWAGPAECAMAVYFASRKQIRILSSAVSAWCFNTAEPDKGLAVFNRSAHSAGPGSGLAAPGSGVWALEPDHRGFGREDRGKKDG